MEAEGLDVRAVVMAAAYNREAGQAAAAQLMEVWPDLTAIIAGNDLIALGAYQEIKRLRLACPKDISVVGHNDMPLVDMVAPALTTIHIGHTEMGTAAASALLDQIVTPGRPPRLTFVPSRLIIRGSVARPGK